jgi:hypothetical protein
MTEYDKVFRFLSENKYPFKVIIDEELGTKVLMISPEFDPTMGMMVKPTDDNWGGYIGLLDVIILPNHKQGLQTAQTVMMEIRNLFSNLH